MAERPRPGPGSVVAALRRLERSVGAERPGRSPLVWLIPVFTLLGTFVLLMFLADPGEMQPLVRLPAALLGSLFMGGMSAAYLWAFAADARDAEATEDDGGGHGRGRGRGQAPRPPAPAPPGEVRRRRGAAPARRVAAECGEPVGAEQESRVPVLR